MKDVVAKDMAWVGPLPVGCVEHLVVKTRWITNELLTQASDQLLLTLRLQNYVPSSSYSPLS